MEQEKNSGPTDSTDDSFLRTQTKRHRRRRTAPLLFLRRSNAVRREVRAEVRGAATGLEQLGTEDGVVELDAVDQDDRDDAHKQDANSCGDHADGERVTQQTDAQTQESQQEEPGIGLHQMRKRAIVFFVRSARGSEALPRPPSSGCDGWQCPMRWRGQGQSQHSQPGHGGEIDPKDSQTNLQPNEHPLCNAIIGDHTSVLHSKRGTQAAESLLVTTSMGTSVAYLSIRLTEPCRTRALGIAVQHMSKTCVCVRGHRLPNKGGRHIRLQSTPALEHADQARDFPLAQRAWRDC